MATKLREIKNQTALLIVPDKDYRKTLMDLTKQASKIYKSVLYVSINDSYDALTRDFKGQKIDTEKFFFIDTRTAASEPHPAPVKNCIFVSSPEALTELKIAISKAYDKQKSELVLLDSLSTLLTHISTATISRWTHDVIAQFRESGATAVFVCLQRDEESFLVKDIAMFVDKIIRLRR